MPINEKAIVDGAMYGYKDAFRAILWLRECNKNLNPEDIPTQIFLNELDARLEPLKEFFKDEIEIWKECTTSEGKK